MENIYYFGSSIYCLSYNIIIIEDFGFLLQDIICFHFGKYLSYANWVPPIVFANYDYICLHAKKV